MLLSSGMKVHSKFLSSIPYVLCRWFCQLSRRKNSSPCLHRYQPVNKSLGGILDLILQQLQRMFLGEIDKRSCSSLPGFIFCRFCVLICLTAFWVVVWVRMCVCEGERVGVCEFKEENNNFFRRRWNSTLLEDLFLWSCLPAFIPRLVRLVPCWASVVQLVECTTS